MVIVKSKIIIKIVNFLNNKFNVANGNLRQPYVYDERSIWKLSSDSVRKWTEHSPRNGCRIQTYKTMLSKNIRVLEKIRIFVCDA